MFSYHNVLLILYNPNWLIDIKNILSTIVTVVIILYGIQIAIDYIANKTEKK